MLNVFVFDWLTAMVVASKDKKLANAVQQLLASSYLRINTSRYNIFKCVSDCDLMVHFLILRGGFVHTACNL